MRQDKNQEKRRPQLIDEVAAMQNRKAISLRRLLKERLPWHGDEGCFVASTKGGFAFQALIVAHVHRSCVAVVRLEKMQAASSLSQS
jgi:hypothetical protein